MKIVDKRPAVAKPEPLCVDDCTPGDVVVVSEVPDQVYLVARVDGKTQGLNLATGANILGRCHVTQRVRAEVHLIENE